HPFFQQTFERMGWQLIGIMPGFDQELIAPGEVRRVYEAVYVKVLEPSTLLRPEKDNMTETVRELYPFSSNGLIPVARTPDAAFNTSASVRREDFKWLKGEHALKAFESSPGKQRFFCSNCGTQVVAHRSGSELFVLRLATLDQDPGQTPQSHIWASHKVPWLA